MRATAESPRMFASDLVDACSRVPWWVVPLLYGPLLAAVLWYAVGLGTSPAQVALEVALGFGLWTLLEYWLHRTFFHWTPAAAWGPRLHFLVHGVHHVWVRDPYRLVMPPAVSVVVTAGVFAACRVLGGALAPWVAPTWVPAVFAGLLAGYVHYDCAHYVLHHRGAGRPRARAYGRLRAHHLAHHHDPRAAGRKFGVSTTLWDHVFGTF